MRQPGAKYTLDTPLSVITGTLSEIEATETNESLKSKPSYISSAIIVHFGHSFAIPINCSISDLVAILPVGLLGLINTNNLTESFIF